MLFLTVKEVYDDGWKYLYLGQPTTIEMYCHDMIRDDFYFNFTSRENHVMQVKYAENMTTVEFISTETGELLGSYRIFVVSP